MHIKRSNGKINKITLALIAAIAGGSYSTVAVAEEQIAKDTDIEVILVKGGKRPKTLQQVAASVTVIGGNEMKQMKVENLEDISASIPNVSISANAIQDTISIRGINSDLQSGGEQSVGIFVDGVYHGRGVQSRFSFLDVETLEVLRGPQGSLFGKNTIAGVISINPAQPKEDLEGKLTVGYETEAERMETNGFVTGALNESGSLTGRLAFKYADSDEGFIKNVAKDTTGVTVTDYAYRGILNWQFDEQLTFNLRAEQGNQENNGIYWEMTQVEAYAPNLAPILGAYKAFGTEGEVDRELLAVLPKRNQLSPRSQDPAFAGFEVPSYVPIMLVAVGLRHQDGEVPSLQLLEGVPEKSACRTVGGAYHSVLRSQDDGVYGGVHDEGEAALLLGGEGLVPDVLR
jgi:iron complex outermembrane receptor protein